MVDRPQGRAPAPPPPGRRYRYRQRRGRAAHSAALLAGTLLLLLLLLLPTPMAALPPAGGAPQERLHRIEQRLEAERLLRDALAGQRERLGAELQALRQRRMVAASATAREDTALASLDAAVTELEERIAAQERALAADQARTSGLIASLLSLARYPPEGLLLQPQAPLEAVRTGTVLSAALPALEQRAAELRRRVGALQADQAALAHRENARTDARATLAGRTVTLTRLMAQREAYLALTGRAEQANRARMARLTDEAGALRGLLRDATPGAHDPWLPTQWRHRREAGARAARYALARKPNEPALGPPVVDVAHLSDLARLPDLAPPPAAPTGANSAGGDPEADPTGAPRLPVPGRVRVAFGSATALGAISPGIEIETRPGALVVAPLPGRIRFAGPFRRYGLLLIVEHGHGYHSLIAGLGQINSPVDQEVMAGEAVGTMGSPPDQPPSLYYELRRNGKPVDPHPLAGSP